jgi:hypothetical protein
MNKVKIVVGIMLTSVLLVLAGCQAEPVTTTVTATKTVTPAAQTVTVTQPAQTITVTATETKTVSSTTQPSTSTTTTSTTKPTTSTTTSGSAITIELEKSGADTRLNSVTPFNCKIKTNDTGLVISGFLDYVIIDRVTFGVEAQLYDAAGTLLGSGTTEVLFSKNLVLSFEIKYAIADPSLVKKCVIVVTVVS